MTTEAIVAAVVFWFVLLGGLFWCFSKWRGHGGGWED